MNAISEKEKEKIKVEVQEILKKFSSALSKIKISKKKNEERVGGFREEGKGASGDEAFRDMLLANAPNKDEDCIIAEKKKW
ncbi:MAG: hypothetical protein FJY98_01715 [Candidatus Liptonbacteria bacterium]|nr:hypothetical protein [Candidatus Pacearchaeota archaeon]MBM3257026.1 hypothetical protein [Candidatus Liptonbacteria bacterium]